MIIGNGPTNPKSQEFVYCQRQFVSDMNEPACHATIFDCPSF